MQQNKTLETIQSYYLYFMAYAVFGWLYEVFLEVVVYRWGFSNRGVLFGPYCPVYGVGAFAFIFTIGPLLKNKTRKHRLCLLPVVYLLSTLLATAIELITSYLCEFFLGSWPWQTYADYRYNFQARIALSPSLRFGIGGVLFLYLLQPLFEKINAKLNAKTRTIVFGIVLGVFCLDALIKMLQMI